MSRLLHTWHEDIVKVEQYSASPEAAIHRRFGDIIALVTFVISQFQSVWNKTEWVTLVCLARFSNIAIAVSFADSITWIGRCMKRNQHWHWWISDVSIKDCSLLHGNGKVFFCGENCPLSLEAFTSFWLLAFGLLVVIYPPKEIPINNIQ